jgi:transcriptional regulator with XRE-family HTH domain
MILLRRVIGDALRARRQAQHRTLREVSTAANVSLGYLSEIERGQKEASSELLAAVCDALGARLSELLREVSSTVASSEGREAPDATLPEQRDPGLTRTQRDESDMAPAGRRGTSDRAAHQESGTERRDSGTVRRESDKVAVGAAEEREAAPVALARVARGPQQVTQAAAPVRASVATLLAGDVSVTVRRDTPLSTTLRARTIRRDVLSGV